MRATLQSALGLAVLLSTTACQAAPPAETYGFVATLGDDTTSVERITRTGDRIVSDAVGRSPVVTRRHWEATLAPDGTIREWTMDTYIPNAEPGANELHHAASFTPEAVRLSRRTARDSSAAAYQRTYAAIVPWNAFVYGTYEVLFEVARGLPDTTRIGQYFFEGWAEGRIGHAQVRPLGDGEYAIRSTGLAGSGVGRLDENGRMLAYSGEGTTYKQEVRRVEEAPDIDAIAERFAAEERARGVARQLSPRDTARATVAGATLEVDYSRPAARGRTLVGALIPYDRVWRTGANAATQLTVSAPVRLGDLAVPAGTYTLWTLPRREGVQLIVNRQTGQWGTEYRSGQDLGRTAMRIDTIADGVEQFTIRVEPGAQGVAGGAGDARLVLEWGTFRWSVPVAAGGTRP